MTDHRNIQTDAIRAALDSGIREWEEYGGPLLPILMRHVHAAPLHKRGSEDEVCAMLSDYQAGRWCGECQYRVVEDPPCCTQSSDGVNVFGCSDRSDNADEPMMPAETLRERMQADGRLWKQAVAEGRIEALDLVRREWCPCVDSRPQDCKPEDWPTSERHGYPVRLRNALLATTADEPDDQGRRQ